MYLSTQDQLEDFCRQIEGEKVIAVDTEFLREKTYYPKLCLVQVGAGELTAAIDSITAESDIETLVKAKGFVDCVAFINGDAVDVTVMTTSDGLTKEEVAQIRDIVLSKCQVTAQNITIVEVK